jgi:hypothetical protein
LNDEENTPLIYKIVVILVIVAAIFATFMSILDFALVRSNSAEISNLSKTMESISGRLNEIDSDISALKQSISPGGVVDEYINSYNFLSNGNIDLEKILTFSSVNPNSDYFSIYITGKKGVWINVTKGGQLLLQADMRPGLSDYVFFLSGTPTVKTTYTISLDRSCVVASNDASNTYFLVSKKGSSELLRMKNQFQPVSEFYK